MNVYLVTLIFMHCNNKSAIVIASNTGLHNRTKHIEVNCHITRHEYEKDKITIPYVSSEAQLADLFTKVQISQQFREVLYKLLVFDAL